MRKGLCRVLAAVLLACLLLTGCKQKTGGGAFGFTLTAEPRQIDPQVATDTASLSVIDAVYEGLARLDDDGRVVPAAADWTVSADGRTYTFTLRESYWSTVKVRGEKTGFEEPVQVIAADFVFGIRRVADPTTGSPYAAQLTDIENADKVLSGKAPLTEFGVEAVDERTLVIRLAEPNADFPEKLTTPAFMPCNREFFGSTGGRYGLEMRYILTNGPFSMSAWTHNTAVSLKKNEHYHAADSILPAAVKYRISTDAEEDFELLEKGYIDGAAVPQDGLERAAAAGIRLEELQDTVRYLWMNTAAPPLSEPKIRQALRDAMEWNALWDSLGAGCAPATGFVPPDATAGGARYREQAAKVPLHTDPTAAQTALANGLAALELQKLPTLTLLAADDAESANLARYILQSFTKNLSITCTLELVDAETLAARVRAGNYQLAIFDVTGTGFTAKENLSVFTTDAVGNYARFSAAAYDALYAQAGADRAAAQGLEQWLYDACPALPLGFCTRYYGVLAEDSGILVRPFNGGAFGALLSFRTADKVTS